MYYLTRFFTFFTLLISLTSYASGTSDSQQSIIDQYEQFKKIKHLNSFENVEKFENILHQLESPKFEGKRSTFYAYAAKLANNNGDLPTANKLLKSAITHLPKLKNSDLLIDALDYLSGIYFNLGDYANAIFYVQKMEDHAFEAKNERGHIIALNRLAFTYLELDFHELAIPVLNNSLKLARQTNNKDTEFLGSLYLINARLEYPTSNPNETMYLIETAQKITSQFNIEDGYISRLKGLVFKQLKDYDQALQWLEKSLGMAKRDNNLRLLRMVHQNLAELYLEKNQTNLAQQHALLSLDIAINLNHKNSISSLNLILSKVYKRNGDASKAFNYLESYSNFIMSESHRNVISLLTMMNKKINSTKQQKKIVTLENSVLAAKLQTQTAYNDQFIIFMGVIAVTIAFIILTIIYLVKIRILSMKVELSMKDTLTGAYGRSYLSHYLPGAQARLLRTITPLNSFGVIAIDCDDFKLINQEFGHAGGDLALQSIVTSLKLQIRANDSLFRWGGDEFVLMCEDVSLEQLREIAQRLTNAVNILTIDYDEKIITPTVSVGYALHKKEDDFDLGLLLKRADNFLYQSKEAGKNNFIGA